MVNDDEPLVFVDVLPVCDETLLDERRLDAWSVPVLPWDVCIDFCVVLVTVVVDLFVGLLDTMPVLPEPCELERLVG